MNSFAFQNNPNGVESFRLSRCDATPLGLWNGLIGGPRVVATLQPWAGRLNPVGLWGVAGLNVLAPLGR